MAAEAVALVVSEAMSHHSELRAYYEAEADQRLRGPLAGPRLEWRQAFIELLRTERRSSVVDFGAGPGRDVAGFRAAGIHAIGLDLAIGNARLAREAGDLVVPGDVAQPPFRPGSFEGAWSMSTLMHLPDAAAKQALAAMAAATVPHSPMVVGVWGGNDELRFDEQIAGQRRPFYRRSTESNTALFSQVAEVISVAEHGLGKHGYQLFQLRSRRNAEVSGPS